MTGRKSNSIRSGRSKRRMNSCVLWFYSTNRRLSGQWKRVQRNDPCTARLRNLKNKAWAAEGYAGLEDKSRAPHNPARKVTMRDINEVKKLASNPDLGAYRVMAALEQIGIKLSRATCGRLLSLNRHLYGLPPPQGGAPR